MNFFKNIIILFTLISFFSCAPTTIEKKQPIEKVKEKIEEIEITDEKVEETKKVESIKKPTKPEDKLINFNNIEKIIVFLSEDEILTSLFYEVFLKEIENFSNIKKAFRYGGPYNCALMQLHAANISTLTLTLTE